ncbi:hypothetical protein [Mesorhizobium sp. WSM3864]|uniref:hypothetical protein n=1 Tax=Mesorhizobium sp. WSM3864 TaxID=2029404 RepID=UPI0014836CF5|nr:hypothetical protein [Mesorhizobium sp. WSM3864]
MNLATISDARKEALRALHDIAGEETVVAEQDRKLVVSVVMLCRCRTTLNASATSGS